ncbi:hypothetical protein GMJAKD_12290 [Candidatus Electrothrix aarhusensis]
MSREERQTTVIDYFQDQAKKGAWGSLYDATNPISYSFILRVETCLPLLTGIQNKKVLDLGCGTGVLLPHVVDNGSKYVGLDISDNMLEILKDAYRSDIEENNIDIILGDIKKIKLPSDIDYAVGLGFIEYFSDPEKIVRKIYSSMNGNGSLILSFPNFHSLDFLFLTIFAPLRYFARKITGKHTVQPPRNLWNKKSALELFESCGFKNVEIIYYHINILPYPFTKLFPKFVGYIGKKIEHTALSNFSLFATSFIVTGKK